MSESDEIQPAQHFVLPPDGDGWKAADISEDELVDDAFIEADPTSKVVTDGPQ